jgi:uncharacterized membrane protein YdjX (TVP38/TMEM64 family)
MTRAEGAGGETGLRLLRLLPLLVLLALLGAILASGVWRHLSLEEIRQRRAMLKALVRLHPALSLLAYVGLYAAVVALSIPGALVMTLSGGLLFGALVGGLAAVAGVSVGAVLMFLVVRTAVQGRLSLRGLGGRGLARIQEGLSRHAFLYLLALRLTPAAPIWMVNVAAGLVGAPLGAYAAATVLGVAPSSFIYAALGAGLDRLLDQGRPLGAGQVLQPAVLLPLAALCLLALAPALAAFWGSVRRRRVAERGGV